VALRIHKQVSLRERNTLGVPATAEYYCELSNDIELQEALVYARSNGLVLSILGGGSNLILAPQIPGLVCHVRLRGIEHEAAGAKVRVRVAAGENWHNFVRYTLGQGWSGLEALSLIPGQVGAAPIQNIGAYGAELSRWVHSLEAIRRDDGQRQVFSAAQCEFAYRHSLFKQSAAYVITAVTFDLRPQGASLDGGIEQYPDVARELLSLGWATPTARQVSEAVIRVRRRKLPDPAEHGNVGSVFQNPVVTTAEMQALAKQIPQLVSYPGPVVGQCKLAAAQLIDAAGWKGRSADGFTVWPRQPLVLVRLARGKTEGGDSNGRGMRDLAAAIAADVAQRYGIQLMLEPQLLGFD
jgi:UDP-N-acetylmuramate dehydrogenase